MLAAEQGNLEIVQELLKKGANCNLEDSVSISIIFYFSSSSHILYWETLTLKYNIGLHCTSPLKLYDFVIELGSVYLHLNPRQGFFPSFNMRGRSPSSWM